jgi:hypothetical protein
LCSRGTYLTQSGGCEQCAAGTFASGEGATSCTLCAPGSFSNADFAACTPCVAGTFLNASSQLCQACSAGSYSPAASAVACTLNPPGFASATQTTFTGALVLAGVDAASFGAAQNATLTATIAASLDVASDTVAIAGATTASSQRRRSLQAAAASVQFRVVTTKQAAAIRSVLTNTSAFVSAMQARLAASADPILSTVSALSAEAPAESSLVTEAKPCEAGTFLNGVTQACEECGPGLVTTSVGATSCAVCPTAYARANASTCVACPANSVVPQFDPATCACAYGYYDTRFGADTQSPTCAQCPVGGVCDTGFVAAANGFWRESLVSDVFYQCRVGNCVAETVLGPLSSPANASAAVNASDAARRRLLAAVPGAPSLLLLGNASSAPPPANCVEGNGGPLCALCLPGYALQSGECMPCDSADAWESWTAGQQTGLLVGCLVLAFIVICVAFFQPLVPALERAIASCVGRVKALGSGAVACLTCACCRRGGAPAPAEAQPGAAAATGETAASPALARAADDNSVGERLRQAAAQAETQDAAPSSRPRCSSEGKHHHHKQMAHEAHVAGAKHVVASNAAFAVGAGVALVVSGGGGGGDDGDDGGGGLDGHLDFLDALEDTIDSVARIGKILVKCVRGRACA